MSRYNRSHRKEETPSLMRVRSIERKYWAAFMESARLDTTQRIPAQGSRQYPCVTSDGKSFTIYAEFGPSTVNVSSNSHREYVRELIRHVRTNGSKR